MEARIFLVCTFHILAMPWFGIDIGGTLTKLVYFEPTDQVEFADGMLDPAEPERLLYC